MAMAKLLLQYKADVNIRNKRGCTPLYESAQKDFADVVGLLASHGADVNMPGEYGSTALHRATQNGCLDTVRVLLAHKADINVRDDGGRTALQAAASNGHTVIVELLERQAPEIVDQKLPGWSRLHEAVKTVKLDEIKRLLDTGINVNITECNGVTPLQNAAEEGAVNITASHNPATDNGFKVRNEFGGAIDPDGLIEIENQIPDSEDSVKRLEFSEGMKSGKKINDHMGVLVPAHRPAGMTPEDLPGHPQTEYHRIGRVQNQQERLASSIHSNDGPAVCSFRKLCGCNLALYHRRLINGHTADTFASNGPHQISAYGFNFRKFRHERWRV